MHQQQCSTAIQFHVQKWSRLIEAGLRTSLIFLCDFVENLKFAKNHVGKASTYVKKKMIQ